MWNFVRKVLGKIAPVVKGIGNFVRKNHQYIAPLAMGLAEASGSDTLKKVAGVGMAASQMASMGAGNYLSSRIAEYRNRVAPPAQPPPVMGVPVGKSA